jgi:hypothetical protein
MSYIFAFMHHAVAVQEAAGQLGIQACVQLSDYALRLAEENHPQLWRSRFIANVDGRLAYTDTRGPGTVGFAGWLPYARRQWKIATDKIAFKRCAGEQEIATPPACLDPSWIGGPFIVKQASSSFGEGIRGPFLAYEAHNPAHQLAPGEYYENFIVGLIAKAWCWDGECMALHLHKPSLVVGDGESTVRQLVEALPNSRGSVNDWDLVGRLATYSGMNSIDDVPRRGKEVLVEFRYGSRYELVSAGNPNVLGTLRGGALAAQFKHAAQTFSRSIQLSPQLGSSCYTLDAIVDSEGTAWFLEMNCNPIVHPDMYGRMMRDCLGLSGLPIGAMRSAEPTMSV